MGDLPALTGSKISGSRMQVLELSQTPLQPLSHSQEGPMHSRSQELSLGLSTRGRVREGAQDSITFFIQYFIVVYIVQLMTQLVIIGSDVVESLSWHDDSNTTRPQFILPMDVNQSESDWLAGAQITHEQLWKIVCGTLDHALVVLFTIEVACMLWASGSCTKFCAPAECGIRWNVIDLSIVIFSVGYMVFELLSPSTGKSGKAREAVEVIRNIIRFSRFIIVVRRLHKIVDKLRIAKAEQQHGSPAFMDGSYTYGTPGHSPTVPFPNELTSPGKDRPAPNSYNRITSHASMMHEGSGYYRM